MAHGGHVEPWLRFSDVTKKFQIAWSIASFPCAVQIPREKRNHDAQWQGQPEVGRSKQEVVVAVDVGHKPARADSIVHERKKQQEHNSEKDCEEDPPGPHVGVETVVQADNYYGSENHRRSVLELLNTVTVSTRGGSEIRISDNEK